MHFLIRHEPDLWAAARVLNLLLTNRVYSVVEDSKAGIYSGKWIRAHPAVGRTESQ